MKLAVTGSILLALTGMISSTLAFADGNFKARLSGYQEVPAISSSGEGDFVVQVSGNSLDYTLSYSGLDSGVLFAHIHLAQPGVSGGVLVFLCSNAPAPVATPACPATEGSVSGVLTPADVVGPGAQGVGPGEFEALLRAIEAGATYVNVHTNNWPVGEIRGQLTRGLNQ